MTRRGLADFLQRHEARPGADPAPVLPELAWLLAQPRPVRMLWIAAEPADPSAASPAAWKPVLAPGSTILALGQTLSADLPTETLVADPTDAAQVSAGLAEARFDLVIHGAQAGPGADLAAFRACFPFLLPGGLYIVEAPVGWLKPLVDAQHHGGPGLAGQIARLVFQPGLAVILSSGGAPPPASPVARPGGATPRPSSAELEAQRDAALARAATIEASTIWRATAPLRLGAARLPALRRLPGQAARLAWWTATGQLQDRLRDRRRRLRAEAAAHQAGDQHQGRPGTFGEPVLRLPFRYPDRLDAPPPRIAVFLHAFHAEQGAEFRRALGNIGRPFDLFVTTDTEAKARTLRQALAPARPGLLEVRVVPNRGRDIAPKLLAFPEAYDDHDIVLHLHSKSSAHNPALAPWRHFVLDGLLGTREHVDSILDAFARLPGLGMIAPRNFPVVLPYMVWGPTFPAARDLAARMGIALTPDSPLDFPAGSMFWARSAALKPLLDLKLTLGDFDEEAGQTDGTPAHAIERLYFYACEKAGLRWVHAGEGLSAREWAIDPEEPAQLQRLVSDQAPALLLPGPRPHPPGLSPEEEGALKQAFRARCAEDLAAFLASGERIALPAAASPEVSILLILYNQAELTFHGLSTLVAALDVPAEVIILDNGSTDDTGALLDRIDGATIIRSPENLHFLRGVNRAAEAARGTNILLLNNDTRVKPGSIAQACRRLAEEPDLGAVGGKIVLVNGTLQEAGSIIWSDGSCLGYGRGRDPMEAEFQFRRDVDYCSGAFLMLRRSLFEALGGLDPAFAPAYYEETDLCMRIRAAGLRIGYDPDIEIAHFEFGSSATSAAALALQARNRAVFTARHAAALGAGHHEASGATLAVARMRPAGPGPRVLIIEDRIPHPSLGAGYPRAAAILKTIEEMGGFVTFYPLVYPTLRFEEAYRLLSPRTEIAAGWGQRWLADFLRSRIGAYDVVLVSRPHNMACLQAALAEVPAFAATTPCVYDAEAIFALREARNPRRAPAEPAKPDAGAGADQPLDVKTRAAIAAEVALTAGARAVFAVNEIEAELFRDAGCDTVRVLGHAIAITPTPAPAAARRDLLFVGALDEDRSPNTDSLLWFVREVMPRLDALAGTGHGLHVVGRAGAPALRGLGSDRIRLLGRVEDIGEEYASRRVFIAPTRYAAGIPHKVHEAAAHGLPVVATGLLTRQLGWSDGVELLSANTADDFAAACARLLADDELWARLRGAALDRVARDCGQDAFDRTLRDTLRDATRAMTQPPGATGTRP